MYGEVPGAQAEYLRVPHADFMPIKVPDGPPDDRFLFLSDVLPTAWQAVAYADVPADGTLLVLGLGPIGDMATRVAGHLGHRVIGVDRVPERLARARSPLAVEPMPWSTRSAWRHTARRWPSWAGGCSTWSRNGSRQPS